MYLKLLPRRTQSHKVLKKTNIKISLVTTQQPNKNINNANQELTLINVFSCFALKVQFILAQWQRLGLKCSVQVFALKRQLKLNCPFRTHISTYTRPNALPAYRQAGIGLN